MNDGLPGLEEFLTFEGRSLTCKYVIGRRRYCLKLRKFVVGDCTCEHFEEYGKPSNSQHLKSKGIGNQE